MGTLLDKPITEKETESGEANGARYGAAAMQGWRVEMEDQHCAVGSIPGLETHSFFAVFDGHGGKEAAIYSAKHILARIQQQPEYEAYTKSGCATDSIEQLGAAMRSAFLAVDVELRAELWTDKERPDHSGCTAIAAIVTPDTIVVANCGDSRSALATRVAPSGVVAMSEDHKPCNVGETERIKNAGGTVSMKRVDGDLAVSRSLGDFQYKERDDLPPEQQKVSPEPELAYHPRAHDKDQALILACDGIWDVMSNEECAEFVVQLLANTGETTTGLVCEELLDECLAKGSRDNMSAVIAVFGAAELAADGGGIAALREERERRAAADAAADADGGDADGARRIDTDEDNGAKG